jgi:hypothetical protein
VSLAIGRRSSSSSDFEPSDDGELIVDLETNPVAVNAARLQLAADAMATQLCADPLVHWASVGASAGKRVLYISYGVAQNIESTDDAARHATNAYRKLRQRGEVPDMSVASVSVRMREDAPAYQDDDDEPAVPVRGALINRREAQETDDVHFSELEQAARALVKTLRAIGERTDADSIDRCLRGGTMSMERLRALRQQLILLRGSHTPFLLGDERQVDNLVRQTNLAVSRFPGLATELLGRPEVRRRAPARPRR